MKEVASLRYGVIFKKAFSVPEIFTAFVRDFVGVSIEIDQVETEKSFDPPIGNVAVEFDLYAQDKKNRIIVDIQHERYFDHSGAIWARFLHYQCVALLQQLASSADYRPKWRVYTLVVLTAGDKHQRDIAVIDFDLHDRDGNPLGEIPHKVIYICPKYVNDETPAEVREWLSAIEDSLDEQVDETHYTRPEIRQVFELIKKDLVTPQERARMFEESHEEELKQSAFEEGLEEGETRKALLIARSLLDEGWQASDIVRITGLTVEQIQAAPDV